ncbi:hypothetical protein V6N13_066322 [Hibiscus sabdariffa]
MLDISTSPLHFGSAITAASLKKHLLVGRNLPSCFDQRIEPELGRYWCLTYMCLDTCLSSNSNARVVQIPQRAAQPSSTTECELGATP